jgi:hypothetical protein
VTASDSLAYACRVVKEPMARYFFDFYENGVLIVDEEGTDCSGIRAAKCEAILALTGSVKDALPDGDHHVFTVKVRDGAGLIVVQASILFDVEIGMDRPAVDRHRDGGDHHA